MSRLDRFRRRRVIVAAPKPAVPPVVSVAQKPTPGPVPVPATGPGRAIPGFTLLKLEEFKQDAKIGEIEKVYGEDFRGYDGFFDTSKRGKYSPFKVLSVVNGVLTYNLHVENNEPQVACVIPFGYKGQTYGRYEMMVRGIGAEGFKIAFMLWPSSDKWEQGEIDFPEADLGGTVSAFSHKVGKPNENALASGSEAKLSDWHVYGIEWRPGYVAMAIDGQVLATTNAYIPKDPMRLTLQAETCLGDGPIPRNGDTAKVEVAWVAQYTYTPNK